MKKFLLISLLAVLVSGLIFSGCAAPAEPEVYTIKFSCQVPEPGWWPQQVGVPFWNEVEERTNGRLKVENYYGQTLVKAADEWEAAKSGITDCGWAVHAYWAEMTTLADVIMLPFLPAENGRHASRVLVELFEKYPSMQAQFKDNKIISLFTTGEYFIATKDKQVKVMEDMAGLKLRVTGATTVTALEALGGVPMFMPMPETYPNIEKGVLDGMLGCWECYVSFRQYELTPYYTRLPSTTFYMPYFSLAMNWDTWNSLPKDIQDIILGVWWGVGSSEASGRAWDDAEQPTKDLIAEGGYQYNEYVLPQDEFARWMDVAARPIWEKWVADNEAKGFTEAQEILDTTLELLDKYRAEYK